MDGHALNLSLESKKTLFRAYDVRGIFGSELNPEMLYKIGLSVCSIIKKDFSRKIKVFVGYDIRQSSQVLAYAFLSGAIATGAEVVFSDSPKPFGVIMYSGLQEKADFTAFITASHLPPEWNGIKFYYGDGVGFSEEKLIEVRDHFVVNYSRSDPLFAKWNELTFLHAKIHFDQYILFMKKNFSLSSPLPVIIDCGNGSASLTAPEVFKQCGYDTILQWTDVDPAFPNRSSEPNEESLKVLSQQVVSKKVRFGVGFDGDGDRAVIVDDLGRVIPADEIAIILAKYLNFKFQSSIKNPLLLANIECSSAFETNLSKNFEIKRIKVGHTFLTLDARLNKSRCLLGVESSGHFVFPQYFLFDDAMLLPLLVGKILEQEKKKLSDLLSSIPKMYAVRKTFKCSDETKFSVIADIVKNFRKDYPQLNDIDGLAITVPEGYVLIRASNTGPKIRLFAESVEKGSVDFLDKKFSEILELAIKNKH